jgi:hypothetical protein
LLHQTIQRRPIQVFHHIVKPSIVRLPIVVNAHRIEMCKPGDGLHFAGEPRCRRGMRSQFRANELHGAWPLQQPMLGQKDFAHPTSAELALEGVLADLLGPPLGVERPSLQGSRTN